MPLTLDQIVPWGRSLSEYVRMFDLTAADLQSRILDCAGGPASFNPEMHRQGCRVVSCDPLYQFSAQDIALRVAQTRETILDCTRANLDHFLWNEMQSPEHLAKLRMAAMQEFLDDLPAGIIQKRYVVAELPRLPFAEGEFDLALSSHFLFTYSELLSAEFHLGSIREMCRVADEARVFPLLGQFGTGRSPHLDLVLTTLCAEGYRCEMRQVPYEYQKGGNQMLQVRRPETDADRNRI